MDLMTISAALTSLRTATEIAKLVINADPSLEKAELKLKLAAMITALAETQTQIVEIKDLVIEKDKFISRLQEALELKGKLVLKDSAYWLPDEKGNMVGGPFCTKCFEVDHVPCTLVADEKEPQVKCPNCGSRFCSKPVYDYLRPDVERRRRELRAMNSDRRIEPSF